MEQVRFEQVVSRGCGLDIHQKVVVATINGEGIRKVTREFNTFTSSLTELRDWLLEYGIEAIISRIDIRIKEMLAPYENVIELLKEVPGLNTKSIEDLIAEIGLDMSVFPNEKHLCSWVGIAPGNNESAGKKKVDG